MKYTIVHGEKPVAEEVHQIAGALQSFNLSAGPATAFKQIALFVQDDAGKIAGGLWAQCAYDWMHVEWIIVPEDGRGQGLGTDLMRRAERLASESGCTGAWLNTLTFQALGFYEKLGYKRFGELLDFPRGGTLSFLQKSLRDGVD